MQTTNILKNILLNFNRTIKELKLDGNDGSSDSEYYFNRTIKELKFFIISL